MKVYFNKRKKHLDLIFIYLEFGQDRLQTKTMTSSAKEWCLSLLFKTKPMIFHFLPYGFSDISVSGEIATPMLFSKKIVKTAYALCENRCLSVNAIERAVRRSAPKRVHQLSDFLFTSVSCHLLQEMFSTS